MNEERQSSILYIIDGKLPINLIILSNDAFIIIVYVAMLLTLEV